MATNDLSGYRMSPRFLGRRAYVTIRPSTQGTIAVGDTVILRESEHYRATELSKSYGDDDERVRVYLEPLTP